MIARQQDGCAWVTGASQGLGRALVIALASDGWTVVASARGRDGLESLQVEDQHTPGRVVIHPLDITDRAAVTAAIDTIEADVGPIALAVLNAGTHRPFFAHDFNATAVRELVELNLMGTVHCLESLLPGMRRRRRGQICVVASLAGYVGLPSSAGYGMTKAGLINLCEALHPELRRDGVLLQLCNPGFVRTPLTEKNEFHMPFLMETLAASAAFRNGLRRDRFEIVFPARLAWIMRILRCLPYRSLFRITERMLR